MVQIAPRPSCDFRRARLLISTALIGLAPVMMTPLPGFAQGLDEVWLNNSGDPGANDPVSGDWAADSDIWFDGTDNAPLQAGQAGVLHHSDPDADITLTIDGTVRADELRLESGHFRLGGGRIGAFDRGELVFHIGENRTLTLNSALLGRVRVTGDGTVYYLAASPRMAGLTIDAGATWDNRGTLTGDVANSGHLAGDGVIEGDVWNDGRLSGSNTIAGLVVNDGTARIGGQTGEFANNALLEVDGTLNVLQLLNNGEVEVASGQRLQSQFRIENEGLMRIAGEVAIQAEANRLRNQSGGRLELDGARIAGGLNNRPGGQLDLLSDSQAQGNFRNNGLLQTGSDTDVALRVTEGNFINQGQILAHGAGRLNITADQIVLEEGSDLDGSRIGLFGRIENEGRLRYSGPARLAGDLHNGVSGLALVAGRLNAGGHALANAGQLDVTGRLLGASSVENTGQMTVAATGELQADALVNAGALDIAGLLDGDLDNREDGIATLDGAELSGGVDNQGQLTGSGTIGGLVQNSGRLEARGVLELGGLDNAAPGQVAIGAGSALNVAADVENAGSIALSGLLDLGGGVLDNRDRGRLAMDGGELRGDLVNRQEARLDLSGDSRIGGNLDNHGRIESSGDARLRVDGGMFRNWGQVSGSGSLTVIADLIVLELGSVIDDLVVRLQGEVHNAGVLDFNADDRLAGDLTNAEGGLARVSADLDADGHDVANAGRFIVQGAGASLRNIGQLSNSGNFDIQSGAVVGADQATNSAGELELGGRLEADLDNRTGATLQFEGGTLAGALDNEGQVQGSGTINGALTNDGEAQLAGSIGGMVDNSGRLQTLGDLSMAGLRNSGQVGIGGGHALRSTGDVVNSGGMEIAGRLHTDGAISNRAGGAITLDDAHLTGDVANAGALSGRADIAGDLVNDGEARLGGSVGDVTNRGGLVVQGDLSLAGLDNSGQLALGSGDALHVAGDITNSGRVEVAGRLGSDGTISNRVDGAITLDDARLSGDVVNEGALSGRADIAGDMVNDGEARLGGSVGDVTNRGDLAVQGDLSVAGLDNSGQLALGRDDALHATGDITNSGRVEVAGELGAEGAISNWAGGEMVLDGARLSGDVENATGALIDIAGDARIRGDLTNRGDIDLSSDRADTMLRVHDGTFTNSGTVSVSGEGSLIIEADRIALETGSDIDTARVELIGAVANQGNLTYSRDAELTGDLRNGADGRVSVNADLDAGGFDVDNAGRFTIDSGGALRDVARLTNSGGLTIASGSDLQADSSENRAGGVIEIGGRLQSDLVNRRDGQVVLDGGRIAGDISNMGDLGGSGSIGGALDNRGSLDFDGSIGDLDNSGFARLAGQAGQLRNSDMMELGGDLSVSGLSNEGSLALGRDHRLTSDSRVLNDGRMVLDGTLDGALRNSDRLSGSGTVSGNLVNDGAMGWGGAIGGDLTNRGLLDSSGDIAVAGGLTNAGALDVGADHALETGQGVLNRARGQISVAGRLAGDVVNRGHYDQTGVLEGSLTTDGSAMLGGRIGGDVDYLAGDLLLRDGLVIGGDLGIGGEAHLRSDDRIRAGGSSVTAEGVLNLGGQLDSAMLNHGRINVGGSGAAITGGLENHGLLDLGDGRADGVVQLGGLSGDGVYALDLDLGRMRADRIELRGGAVQGRVHLGFNDISDGITARAGQRVTLLDVDEGFGAQNDFRYSYDPIGRSSERVVFSVDQRGPQGDLELVSQTNPAIGALFGNVALTQSLIGSVINRPTSPFVTGLAYEDSENPCGPGIWARATGGHATANGATDNGISRVNSEVKANYHGLQLGGDLACFDGRYSGWDMAFGMLAGVNKGDTSQPVYAVDGSNSQALSGNLTSITTSDFTQGYGGIYATATRGRFQAELQYRYENTDFTIRNRPLAGVGLGLERGQEFSSSGNTVSGSVSYAIPLGQNGWAAVPTAGFAWSRLSTDSISFASQEGADYLLTFEDSDRKVGFAGATLARTFVQPARNEALYAFATGTWYKDFADPTVSVFSRPGDGEFEAQRLVSDNLGSYGEISLGANYIKVLSENGRGRQFSSSARIDARFGDGLDSVGVTGQIRWQF